MRGPVAIVVGVLVVAVIIGGLWAVFDEDDDTTEQALGIGWISVPFSLAEPASVDGGGSEVVYRGDAACNEGEQLRIRIRVAQDGTEGEGEIEEPCTGEVQRFEVPVVADGPGFEAGVEAEYWGWAATFVDGEDAAEPWEWEGETVLQGS
jgi:hypothetical protein